MQVFAYVCADTVEIRTAEIIAGKQKMADLLVDGVDVEALAHWDKADLPVAAGWYRAPGLTDTKPHAARHPDRPPGAPLIHPLQSQTSR